MVALNILIVEDERIVAVDIKNSLESSGYNVAGIAASGETALKKVAETHPDLVLMDIHLKGEMDGVQTAKKIRDNFNIPVIYLTANADPITLQRAKVTEPFGYILKPFEDKELTISIEMAIYKHQQESQVKTSQQRLATVLRSIGDAIIATNDQGLVTFMNPVAEALTGWTQEEALGRDLTKVFHVINSQTRTLTESSVNIILRQRKVTAVEENLLLITKNKAEIPIAECATPILDDTEKITGVVLAFRDITVQQQAEAEVYKALAKEKELNSLKSNFVSTTSHEFRTPLATILSSADMLELYSHKWSEAKKVEHLHRIQSAAERMTELLDDVLLMSKAEAGKLEFQPEPLNLSQFCQALVEEMQLIAGDKQINLVSEGNCAHACLDERLVRHILSNLLSNAIKYSPTGSTVEFHLRCDQTAAIFAIADHGIGIPEADQAQLFQSFHRASNVGNIAGTGLGLSIVKKAVDLHGGAIAFNSQAGVGTTFTVTLPFS